MSVFSHSKNPPWLDTARDFCSARNITIMSWGSPALMVEAKSPERAAEIFAQLANLGFQPVPDPDDDNAGILTLSRSERLLPVLNCAGFAVNRDVAPSSELPIIGSERIY
ncbi:MAG TPA: hypothetical protein VEI49_05110 [Terriglobales bacterium]|nr:hypothetical protein [Terriglobales bacterium]